MNLMCCWFTVRILSSLLSEFRRHGGYQRYFSYGTLLRKFCPALPTTIGSLVRLGPSWFQLLVSWTGHSFVGRQRCSWAARRSSRTFVVSNRSASSSLILG